ncbi:MAG: DUF4405 domain-containing protein [Anaerolineaceae bacterium]|nr:DUF4405 domain-containing protein [Anaerolineaceae bacterium]
MEEKRNSVSSVTLSRWLLFLLLSITGIAVFLSSVYFLYFPVGFQGGNNPDYGTIIVFDREMWSEIHLWFGVGMMIVLIVHIVNHDKWILMMFKRFIQGKSNGRTRLNRKSRFNTILDAVAGLSFVVVAISGAALMFLPGGKSVEVVSGFLLSRETWDVIHTWSGVVMLIFVLIHFYIHWKWITKVTKRVVGIKKKY